MAKYLITGGCGFIGSHLSRHLLSKGHQIRILDDLSTGKKENIPPHTDLFIGNITKKEDLKKALEGVDGCFHLAAIVSIEKTFREWTHSHYVNLFGTVNLFETLIEMTLKIPIVFASTAAVYGSPSSMPIGESFFLRPLSPYGADKIGCEHHAMLARDLHGIPVTIFRLFNVYGPGQDPLSSYSGVISIFSKKILNDEPLTIFGNGEQQRDFIYVEDVVRFLIEGMEKQHTPSPFNLCSGKGTSIHQLINMIEKLADKKAKKIYAPQRKGDIFISVGNPSHAENFFGMKPSYSLEQGLFLLLEHLKIQGRNICVGNGYL